MTEIREIMDKFYVYMYMDQDNVPFYIGKGKGVRWYPSTHLNGHTYYKIKSIGVDNIKIHFLHKDISEEEAFKWEAYWIKYLGRKDNGTGQLTNHTDGGEGNSGRIMTDEHKRKIGEANIGKVRSDEAKQKMSEAAKGRKLSDETKQKMSEFFKDRVFSDEHKQKLKEAAKGNTNGIGNKGKKMSEEQKQRISESMQGRKHSEETRKKMCKPHKVRN